MSALAKNTKNNSKIAKKQPIVNIKNTKYCTKMSAAGGPDFTFTLQGASRPPAPRQLRHCICTSVC